MLPTFLPPTPVASIFFHAVQLAAQRQSEQEQYDAKNGISFGTQENIHQPQ